jgi:methylated-DNA-[protein]-cysteine S-methyltransferase
MLLTSTQRTPIGTLFLIADGETLLAAGFRSLHDLQSRLVDSDREKGFKEVRTLPMISGLISHYFDGDFDAINQIAVRQPGMEFSQKVWRAMRRIPASKTLSYSELAHRSGSPKAVRAAGSACAKNLIAPIIPCHRIVRSDGTLGNYGYGREKKEWLLRFEGVF